MMRGGGGVVGSQTCSKAMTALHNTYRGSGAHNDGPLLGLLGCDFLSILALKYGKV